MNNKTSVRKQVFNKNKEIIENLKRENRKLTSNVNYLFHRLDTLKQENKKLHNKFIVMNIVYFFAGFILGILIYSIIIIK